MLVRNLLFLLQLLVLWVFPSFPFRFITNSKIYQRVATTTSSSIYQPMNAQLMLYQSVKVDSQNKISSRQRIYIYNLIEILSRYKELYGNYSIPAKFTIPSTQDWPEHSWGLQLGMKVVDIRRGRSFQSCSSIELLHRIGFPLISQRLLKKIFKTDESLNVSLNIIPGINKTRKRHRYNYEQDILTPCRIYKAVYGNLFIPIDWIVPEDNIWPQLYWGYNLGHKLQLFRKDSRYMCYINTKDQDFINSFETNVICEQLNELGFVWNIKDYKFFKLLQVILRYKDIYGHVNVPVRYIVPESLEFPISFHGYRLGFIWHRFRRGYMFYNDKYLQQLSQLDLLQYMSDKLLSYNSYESNCEWNKFAIDTSITKIEQNHHLNISFLNEVINTFISIEKSDINSISSSYKISVSNQSDNNWPCSSSGLKLGKIIKKFHRLGSENVTKDIRDMLVKHGFIFKANFNDVNVLIHAIEIFKSIEGHVDIPMAFCVPIDSSWPSSMTGMRLGYYVSKIRLKHIKLSSAEEKKIQELGVVLETSRDKRFKIIINALLVHQHLFGDMDVPRYFIVPQEKPWPKSAWGLQLGNRVRNIRYKKSYYQQFYYDNLKRIGFPMNKISDKVIS